MRSERHRTKRKSPAAEDAAASSAAPDHVSNDGGVIPVAAPNAEQSSTIVPMVVPPFPAPYLPDAPVGPAILAKPRKREHFPATIRNGAAPGRIEIDQPASNNEALALDTAKYRQRPYRPDTTIDGWTTEHFVVRAASMRGQGHRSSGAPRQDDFAIGRHAPTGSLVLAVADGVSSADCSAQGSTAACRFAVEAVLLELDSNPEPEWSAIVRGAAWSVVETCQRLDELAEPDPEAAHRRYATTLSAACVTPLPEGGTAVSAVSVGDSGVRVLRKGRILAELGDDKQPDSGITSSSVACLPRIPVELPHIHLQLDDTDILMLATDGIWDAVGKGTGLVGELLISQFTSGIPDRLQFGRIVDFSRATFLDDRTLIAVWNQSPKE